MTIQEFMAKWRKVELKERSAGKREAPGATHEQGTTANGPGIPSGMGMGTPTEEERVLLRSDSDAGSRREQRWEAMMDTKRELLARQAARVRARPAPPSLRGPTSLRACRAACSFSRTRHEKSR